MKRIMLLILLMLLLLISACPNSPTNPTDENSYKQEKIDWPSLADSPWPIWHSDPQNTGRSQQLGAQLGSIINTFPSDNSQAGIVTGLDSILFFYNDNGIPYLQATTFNGDVLWSKEVHNEPSACPSVLYDGSLVTIGLEDGELIRLSASGDTLWQCFIDVEHPLWAANCGITVGLDTTIFFVTSDQRRLIAISSSGEEKWSLVDDRIYGNCTSVPVFSPNGETLYINGDNGVSLLAIDIESQSIKWTYGDIPLNNSPIVDCNGNIFVYNGRPIEYSSSEVADYSFTSLNYDGTIRWKYDLPASFTYGLSPTMDWNGNIYFATSDTLYSLTNDGKERWKLPGYYAACPLISDANNNIYCFKSDDCLIGNCISSTGEIVWSVEFTGENTRLGGSPIIFNDLILLPGWRSEWIYVIQ